jgi:hypothetical protein
MHYEAQVVSVSDYYPFGSPMPGRYFNANSYSYGYNGQMKTDEISGTGKNYTAEFWEYDPRVVHRWNQDPKQIIGVSPYVINGNNPIYYTDPNGDFRTKFGANVYKFFHGGTVTKAQYGDRAGEYYVNKKVDGGAGAKGSGSTLDEVVVAEKMTWNWGGSSAAEYARGGAGAAFNFGKFLFGGGGNTTYKEGSFEADEMASSPGVQKGLEALRNQQSNSTNFGYKFSPNPKDVLKNGLDGFSDENKEAHIDVFKDQSWTKLYVGGYTGTIRIVDANTVRVTIENKTTANSFLLHGGELIFGKENGAKRFNDLWNKTPFLNTQSQRFEFSIPFKK